jgi:hypothetical protein
MPPCFDTVHDAERKQAYCGANKIYESYSDREAKEDEKERFVSVHALRRSEAKERPDPF